MIFLILQEDANGQQWLGMPKNIFFLLILVIIALICFGINRWRFSKLMNISPTKVRKATAGDGHKCSCTLEVEVDNWLYAQRFFHNKPETAEKGEYFENTTDIPNFVVFYPGNKFERIHSIIVLKDVPRRKGIPDIVFTPDLKPKYKMFVLNEKEILDPEWQEKAFKFYHPLRQRVKKWAKKEGIRLIDLREEYEEKDGRIIPKNSKSGQK
jgi:hypothetical protein